MIEESTLYSAPDKQIYELIKLCLSNPKVNLTSSGDLSYSAQLEIDRAIYNIVNNVTKN